MDSQKTVCLRERYETQVAGRAEGQGRVQGTPGDKPKCTRLCAGCEWGDARLEGGETRWPGGAGRVTERCKGLPPVCGQAAGRPHYSFRWAVANHAEWEAQANRR